MQHKNFFVYQRRTWDEYKRVLSVAHAIQPTERGENLEYRNQLSGVCWGAVYCSIESIFLNQPVFLLLISVGDRGSTVVKALCYKSEGRWFDPTWFHWNFSLPYNPSEVNSASKRNEYQEYFLGVKSGRCVRLTTLPPSCAVVTKSGNLNFLEPSGHLGPVMGLIYLYSFLLEAESTQGP